MDYHRRGISRDGIRAGFVFMRIADYLDDLLIVSGLGLGGYGLWLVDPPLAYIIIGALMLIIGLFAAWRRD
jgi:hypothetical protein